MYTHFINTARLSLHNIFWFSSNYLELIPIKNISGMLEASQTIFKKDRVSIKKIYFIKKQIQNWQFVDTLTLQDKNECD